MMMILRRGFDALASAIGELSVDLSAYEEPCDECKLSAKYPIRYAVCPKCQQEVVFVFREVWLALWQYKPAVAPSPPFDERPRRDVDRAREAAMKMRDA
jgi:hypothetical protein